MRDMVRVPAIFVVLMQAMFWVWPKLKAVAHTLPYDAAVMGDYQVPAARFAAIHVPTLVMHARNDARVPFELGRRMAAGIPGARFIPLESPNHIMLEGEPALERFLEELKAFIGPKAGH